MARLLEFVSSQDGDAPFIRSFLNTIGGYSRPLDADTLSESLAFTVVANLIPPSSPAEAASLAALFPSVSSSLAPPTETAENLFIPVFRRNSAGKDGKPGRRIVLGDLYGDCSPNAMAIRMLSQSVDGPPPVQVARRFVVDLDQSPDALEFLEYEWFSNGKLVVSMHTFDLDGDYGGTSVVLQCDHEISAAAGGDVIDLGQEDLSVCMRLKFSEYRDCASCGAPRAVCPCPGPSGPLLSLPKEGTSEQLTWETWQTALAKTRNGATSTLIVDISANTPFGVMENRVRFRVSQKCEIGAESGVAMIYRQLEATARKLSPVFDAGSYDFPVDNSTVVEDIVGGVADDPVGPTPPAKTGNSADDLSTILATGSFGSGQDSKLNSPSLVGGLTSSPQGESPEASLASLKLTQKLTPSSDAPGTSPSSPRPEDSEKIVVPIGKSSGGVQKKSFPCNSCDAVFHHRGHLNVHVMARYETGAASTWPLRKSSDIWHLTLFFCFLYCLL